MSYFACPKCGKPLVMHCNECGGGAIRTDNRQTLANALKRIEELELSIQNYYATVDDYKQAQSRAAMFAGQADKLESQRDRLLAGVKDIQNEAAQEDQTEKSAYKSLDTIYVVCDDLIREIEGEK